VKKAILVAVSLLGLAGAALAATVYCPLHSYATCYDTGEISPTGSNAHKYHCTCNDDVWVAPDPPASTSVPAPPPQSLSDSSKQAQETGHAIGASIGQIIAQNRARHAEEKRDLTMIVYCRQNPTASVTPNKKQLSCVDVNNFAVAYCTVHENEKLCKDVAKLPPQGQAAVAVTPHVQKEQLTGPPAAKPQAGARTEDATVGVTATPEISVVEAARRNKATKETPESYLIESHVVVSEGEIPRDDYTIRFRNEVLTIRYSDSQTTKIGPDGYPTEFGIHSWYSDPDLSQFPLTGSAIRACLIEKNEHYGQIVAHQPTSEPCMSREGNTLVYTPAPNAGDFAYVHFDIRTERIE
jgi:hypothetical protein